jgi:hypothetical protein
MNMDITRKTWRGSATRRALFATAILLTTSQMAMAAGSTMLVCRSNNNGSLGPDLFELNEAKSSITIKFSPARGNAGTATPARTEGPYHATFTPNTITVSGDDGYGLLRTYIINRIAGTVTVTYVSDNLVRGHAEWTCQVGKAKF